MFHKILASIQIYWFKWLDSEYTNKVMILSEFYLKPESVQIILWIVVILTTHFLLNQKIYKYIP